MNSPYGICLGHNGNLTNYDELFSNADQRGPPAPEYRIGFRGPAQRFCARVAELREWPADCRSDFRGGRSRARRCKGGYAVVALIVGIGVVAFRDPNGIRPLVLGERETEQGSDYNGLPLRALHSMCCSSNGFAT